MTIRTLTEAVRDFAQRQPNVTALREKSLGVWREISWQSYLDNIAAFARQLSAIGVGPGDHVAIISDNRPEWLYAELGAQSIGARAVGVYQTNPAPEVSYVVKHCGAKVLVCEDQEQLDKAIETRDETPLCTTVVVIDPRGTRHYTDDRLVTWTDFVDAGQKLLAEDPDWFDAQLKARDPDEPAMVVYTSGTTGTPKGALISNTNVMTQGRGSVPRLGATSSDTILSYLPLCHVAEKIFTEFLPLQVGAVVHFGESIETVREDLIEVSPTIFLGVPRIWEKMHASVTLKMRDASWLKRTLFDFFSVRGREIAARRRTGESRPLDRVVWAVGDLLVFRPLQERLGLRNCRLPVSGAAPISPELIEWFHGIGIPISEGYGQTECGGVSHFSPPSDIRIGTVGPVLPELECTLAADGEILVRGAPVFCGYLHDETATKNTIDADGWLHTGDLGSIDPDGYLSITGRKKEIIITAGGKNISPERIENALKMSAYIKEAVAIGDGRKFIGALVQIDYDAVGDWASRKKLVYTSFEDLSGNGEVVQLIRDELLAVNEGLAHVEHVREVRLFRKELHQDDGELTPTQKVRRSAVGEIYTDLIESIYTR